MELVPLTVMYPVIEKSTKPQFISAINEIVAATVKLAEYFKLTELRIRSAQLMNDIILLSGPNLASLILYCL